MSQNRIAAALSLGGIATRNTTTSDRLFLVATTSPTGDRDRCSVVLRGEVSGEWCRVREHALLVLQTLARRHPNCSVQLLDEANVPHLVATAAGGAL